MSDRKADLKEKEWADSIPETGTDDAPEPYEETYRDGSAKNECWNDRDRD